MKLLGLLLLTAHAFEKGSKQESNKFLSRERRANGFSEEWFKSGDLERECIEEVEKTKGYLRALSKKGHQDFFSNSFDQISTQRGQFLQGLVRTR